MLWAFRTLHFAMGGPDQRTNPSGFRIGEEGCQDLGRVLVLWFGKCVRVWGGCSDLGRVLGFGMGVRV